VPTVFDPNPATTMDSMKNLPTDDEHLFRVVDRKGDWTYYYHDQLKKYLVAVNHVLQIGFPKGQGLIQYFKRMTEEEAERALNTAAERGANVHSAIRMLTAGQKLQLDTQIKND